MRIVANTSHWGIGAMVCSVASRLMCHSPSSIVMCNAHVDDVFPRYFKPVCGVDCGGVVVGRDGEVYGANVCTSPELMHVLRTVASRWLVPRVGWFRNVVVSRRTLGVHYRGTDKHLEVPRTSFDVVRERVERVRVDGGFDSVLFCTDDASVVVPESWLHFRFHLKAEGGVGLHHMREAPLRHMDEAFVQLLSLASCGGLVVGRSCFSEAALILGRGPFEYYN